MRSCVINHLSNFVYVQGWSFKRDLVKKKKEKRKIAAERNAGLGTSEQWWCFLAVVQLLSHV